MIGTDDDVRRLLSKRRTIAVVGASPNEARPSHRVLRYLHAAGHDVIPVNPRPGLTEIAGLPVAASLPDIERPVDIVDVFRRPEHLPDIARQAVDIGARALWGQLGVENEEAAEIAIEAGLTVIMNRCPAIEIPRLGIRLSPSEGDYWIGIVG